MENIREDIKTKLLKTIEESSEIEETHTAVVVFREFLLALRTEAEIEQMKKQGE